MVVATETKKEKMQKNAKKGKKKRGKQENDTVKRNWKHIKHVQVHGTLNISRYLFYRFLVKQVYETLFFFFSGYFVISPYDWNTNEQTNSSECVYMSETTHPLTVC